MSLSQGLPSSPLATPIALERAVNLSELPFLPLLRPSPPRLSEHLRELEEIEASGTYSNYGPVNTRFERELISSLFHTGHCLTVCNATVGLMLAIREVIGENRPEERRYALMPSFTFAATAHAALWCGLTPLFCDIDPETWLPSAGSEEALLTRYAGQIAVIVPYATFGNNLDLGRYDALSERHGVPVVIDAASSLGSLDKNGEPFGMGCRWPIVFSMHATKAFSVGEGGIVYCGDEGRIDRLRGMGAFGFGPPRTAVAPGLNAKLTEVGALTGLLQLRRFPAAAQQRTAAAGLYRGAWQGDFAQQRRCGHQQMQAFESILLPPHMTGERPLVLERLAALGIGAGLYFSPHLAEQPYFQRNSIAGPLPHTEDLASRILSLPLLPEMTMGEVQRVVAAVREATTLFSKASRRAK